MQFNLVFYLGKAFNCDLLDELDEEFLESLPESEWKLIKKESKAYKIKFIS